MSAADPSAELPVVAALPALRTALADTGRAVLAAPPGSGKTTLVPLRLLNEPWLAGRRIVVLEPRRVAARAAAARMAQLLGERVGQRVGYHIRFERRVGPGTRIEVVTEGLLARRLQADPELPGVGLLIFDEFHERSLHSDLAIALAREARETLRPDLRLLVMSATLDTLRVARWLDDAPVVTSDGRLHPVDVRYRPMAAARHGDAVADGICLALDETEGDLLAFLPGVREISDAQQRLAARRPDVRALPLHGTLSSAAQDAALRPADDGVRKVILATNIAQTSLTVEGVTTVVDGGFVRVARYDLAAGADRLLTERVSHASAEQRAGRAGRLGPGVAYRLWSRDQHGQLAQHDTPEILVADLSRFALELSAWGIDEVQRAALLDAPPLPAWTAARGLLSALGAVDADGRITDHGRALLRLPLPPRRAQLLLAAQRQGRAALAAWLVAILDERLRGDDVDLAEIMQRALRTRHDADSRRLRDTVTQLLRQLDLDPEAMPADDDVMAVGRLVALAYPERIARRREGQRGVFQCADGGEARMDAAAALAGADWLAVAHWAVGVAGSGATRRIQLAAAINVSDVRQDHASQLRDEPGVEWDAASGAVLCERRERLGALVLRTRPWPQAPRAQVAACLLEGLRATGLEALPWTDGARGWQARVESLRQWRPDDRWPAVDDVTLLASLGDWLGPYLDGVTRLQGLASLDLGAVLATRLDYVAQQRLASLAPERLTVPSGSQLRLHYFVDARPPVLEVKLQELFGLAETPTVDGGRRPVMLHLLSPARRPIQVTQDLNSFWARTYPEVKKELKGRYPRHPWPDDPMAAPATARAKPRGT